MPPYPLRWIFLLPLRVGSEVLLLYLVSRFGSKQEGFTLPELLVTISLSSVVMLALISQYSLSTGLSHDGRVRIATTLQAQAIMQTMGAEIRSLGNGVPFDQSNFQIGDVSLSNPTVTEPIDVATSTTTFITFRLNETGTVYLLTQDFDPSLTQTIFLTDVTGLDVNDPIYLSNSVVSGDEGLYGVITAVDTGASSVTIDAATYVTSAGATFDTGSICEEVPSVTYASPGGAAGITRDSGFGAVSLGPDSAFVLEYLDENGAVLTPPLLNTDLVNSLRKIRVTVSVNSSSVLADGSTYTASASQVFAIRNLNYVF